MVWLKPVRDRSSPRRWAPRSFAARRPGAGHCRGGPFEQTSRNRISVSIRGHFANGIGRKERVEEWLEGTYWKSYWADMTCPSAASSLLRTYQNQQREGSCIYRANNVKWIGQVDFDLSSKAERGRMLSCGRAVHNSTVRTGGGLGSRKAHAPCVDRISPERPKRRSLVRFSR